MAKNNSYVNGKKEKNNEFYTQYQDIQREINAYIEYNPDTFRDKVILLPCDDPEWSNFTRFFAQNFENLGIKKLISTSYSTQQKIEDGYQYSLDDFLTDFELKSNKFDKEKSAAKGKIFTLTRDINNSKMIDIDDLQWTYLEGNGDFRSEEVKLLRDEADIIITNPPFSLLTEFIQWIFEAQKQFIIIGSIGSIMYRDNFNLIKSGKMWLGNGFNGGNAYFKTPIQAKNEYANGVFDENTGLVKFRNCCWYTNLDHGKRHQPLQLMSYEDNLKYSKHKEIKDKGYQKYDNYDAIEVKYVDAIPSDYDGVMGVASSFLEKYCPEQFEIVGATQTGCHDDDMIKNTYKDYIGYHQDGTPTGRTGSTCGHNPMLEKNDGIHDYYMNKDGKMVQSVNGRILIKRKVTRINENNS